MEVIEVLSSLRYFNLLVTLLQITLLQILTIFFSSEGLNLSCTGQPGWSVTHSFQLQVDRAAFLPGGRKSLIGNVYATF